MAAVTISRAQVTGWQICPEGIDIALAVLPARGRMTLGQARDAGTSFEDVVWVAAYMALTDKDADRRLRLWMADCAARVLHVYEKTEACDAMRGAVVAARRYARGEVDKDAWAAARAAGRSAAQVAAGAAAREGFYEGLSSHLIITGASCTVKISRAINNPITTVSVDGPIC
jgi:hypothetical protein